MNRWRAARCAGGLSVAVASACGAPVDGAAPVVREVTPPVVCLAASVDEEARVTLHGAGFAPLPLAVRDETMLGLPSIVLTHARNFDGSDGKGTTTRFAGEPGGMNAELVRWASEREMELVVRPSQELRPGLYDVTVENPNGRQFRATDALAVAAAARVTAVEPAMACVGGGEEVLHVAVSGGLAVDGSLPRVWIGGVPVSASDAEDCTEVPFAGARMQQCGALLVDLAGAELSPGVTAVTVEDAAGCAPGRASAPVEVVLVDAPAIDEVNRDALCQAAVATEVDLVFSGRGFLRLPERDFEVRVAGQPVEPWGIDGCVPVDGAEGATTCTSFRVTLDPSALPLGPVTVDVVGPPPADCVASTSAVLEIVGPPRATAISPAELCSDVPTTVVIEGNDLAGTSSVRIGEREASAVVVEESGARLTATFPDGIAPGSGEVSLSAGGACASTTTVPFVVNATPRPLVVDPAVVFHDVATEVVVFADGLADGATSVSLVDGAGAAVELSFSTGGRVDRLVATVPRGLPDGSYELHVTGGSGCESRAPGRLVVTGAEGIALSHVEPGFASSLDDTGIVVHALPTAASGPAFEAGARAYLRALDGGAALPLRGSFASSAQELSAVVPAGLPAGGYDVIVVNPSGDVGVLSAALAIAAREAPRVTSVEPRSLAAGQATAVVALGEGFDADGVTATAACADFATGQPVPSPSISVDAATATTLALTVHGENTSGRVVCAITVRNVDGSESAPVTVSFGGAAHPLGAWTSGAPMREARRGHALAVLDGARGARWLYAVGGDAGASTSVKTTIDVAPVDALGRMGGWSGQRYDLSDVHTAGGVARAPRAFAGAVAIGPFLYLVGGADDAGPTTTLLRARLLDPRDAPAVVDVSVSAQDAGGLEAGVWSWSVAARYPADHAHNPGGESLPGARTTLEVPPGVGPLAVALTWARVPGASGYRVYRELDSAAGGLPPMLVADLDGEDTTTFVDDGASALPAVSPLPPGSLGRWHEVPGVTLGVPRARHATVAVVDPTNAGRTFLYAVGGEGHDGVHASGERAVIVTVGDAHAASPFAPLTASLSFGRADLDGVVVTATESAAIAPGAAYLFLSGGSTASQTSRDFEAARIEPDGDVLSFVTLRGPTPARAGAAALVVDGSVVLLGGTGGSDAVASLTAPAPSLSTWSGLASALSTSRTYMGRASGGRFLFVSGGSTQGAEATDSVERNLREGEP